MFVSAKLRGISLGYMAFSRGVSDILHLSLTFSVLTRFALFCSAVRAQKKHQNQMILMLERSLNALDYAAFFL